ncbi:MAG: family hydrolase [Sphingomonas bacterium]|nr:family hydrolase [Sphingomonas bacterium]
MSNRLAIFDCDGTLADGANSICLAMEQCFTEASLTPPSREATRRIVGLNLPEAMRLLHPAGDEPVHRSLAAAFKTVFQGLRAGGLAPDPLFDGMAEAIVALDESGWLLGVATGKSDRGLSICLDHHGLGPRFVTLQTADRHPSKPHPSMIEAAMAEAGAAPASTAMIGDTSFDMAMARAAGVFAIGVTWGYHDRAELIDAGADCIAERPADIPALLEKIAA